MIIAIDGPSGSGKGTLSKRLADHFNLAVLDTGRMYRQVGLAAIDGKVAYNNEIELTKIARSIDFTTPPVGNLKQDQVAVAASKISKHAGVRKALLDFQRNFAYRTHEGLHGALLDGRDIGTNICPDADIKIFLTSAVEVRAQRRFKELQESNIPRIYEDVLADMLARDSRDSSRKNDPLKPAADAFILDTSEKTIEDVVNAAVDFIANKQSQT